MGFGLVFDRIDLSLIYPGLVERLQEVSRQLDEAEVCYWATSGLRDFREQDSLYQQGRTKPGPIVTHAPAGYSAHNYGCAVDFVRDEYESQPGVQPVWVEAAYQPLAEAAKAAGLEAGFYWPHDKRDCPHIQMRLPWAWTDLIHYSEDGHNIKAVWALLDRQALQPG